MKKADVVPIYFCRHIVAYIDGTIYHRTGVRSESRFAEPTVAQEKKMLDSQTHLQRRAAKAALSLLNAIMLFLFVAVPAAAQSIGPSYGGLWWAAPAGLESGWGINFAHQGNTIFASWFTYDPTGRGLWLVMTAPQSAANTYSGALYTTTGPAFNAVPFNPAQVVATQVGTGTLTFTDANTATFAYTVNGASQNKTLTREVFGTLPVCATATGSLSAATNYQDLWWASPPASESGWGINLTHQGDTIFATWFTYDLDGTPMWLVATASQTVSGTYTGTLYRTTGPAFNAAPFDPAGVVATQVGSATFTFSDGNTGTFAYVVNGVAQTKNITRELFSGPGTVCQDGANPLPTANLVVTNTTDVVNGDTSSPAALVANPGPDGISLREAVRAANNAPGTFTTITFAPSLGPILLGSPLIFILANGMTIEGQTDASDTPLTVVDCSAPATGLVVVASNVTIRHLSFVNKTQGPGYIQISAYWQLPNGPRSPNSVGGILVEENSFTGNPNTPPGIGVTVGPTQQTINGGVSNVTIRKNLFENMYGDADATNVSADGSNTATTDVIISDNVFRQIGYGMELSVHGTGTSVQRVSFIGNNVQGAWAGVTAGFSATQNEPPAIGDVIEDVAVGNNVIAGALYTAVGFGAGNTDATSSADNNIIRRISIINNVLVGLANSPETFATGVNLSGSSPPATNGHIDGVNIINNTITGFLSSCCALYANAFPSSGGSIENVILRNAILWNNAADVWWNYSSLEADHSDFDPVKTSLSPTPPGGIVTLLTGVGNIFADPLFLNPTQGDFHLTAASPAIGAGTSNSAPLADIAGCPRPVNRVDLGAYEFGTCP